MVEKSKPPIETRRIVVDGDLPQTVNGTVYHPHAGEWIDFNEWPSMGLYIDLKSMGDLNGTAEQLNQGVQRLAGLISAWEWTNSRGEPYESPPTAETVKNLPPAEFGWLIAAASREPERPNSSTPST